MKHSLAVVCTLASIMGASSLVFTNCAAAQTSRGPAAHTPAESTADSPAGPDGPSKVAVIVFQQAVVQTNEGQRALAQLREKFAPRQAALKSQSDEIDSLKKQLQDAGSTLSDQERDSRLRTIDEKTKSLQRSAEDAQNDFNSEMNETLQGLAQKVFAVVDSYAKQHGYTLVLDASNQQTEPVLWVSPSNDITKAIVDAYNAKSGVPAPAAQPPSAPTPHPGASHTSHPTNPQ